MAGQRSLAQWLEHQQRQHPRAIELGLERVRIVAQQLDLAALPYPTILVAGTNGKGSTVAFLTALARAHGLRVGTFTSPHLVRYAERIAVDGAETSEAALVAAFERIERARSRTPLTFFEYSTLAAHLIFREACIDLGIIEVGLGGRLDATNAFDADVAVICSVALDHVEYLGADRESIGREKAGILRADRAAILGTLDMPQSVREQIERTRALARWPQQDFGFERDASTRAWRSWGWSWDFAQLPKPALEGAIQYQNASTAIAALTAWCESPRRAAALRRLEAAAVAVALRDVRLNGRMQIVQRRCEWVLDVAHNPAAAQVLAAGLASRARARRCYAILGVLADKDAAGIVAALQAVVDEWLLCTLEGERGSTAQQLQSRLAPLTLRRARLCDSIEKACAEVDALTGPQDRVLVLGSFHAVGPALEWLGL